MSKKPQKTKIPLTIHTEGMEKALGKERWRKFEKESLWKMVCRIERERKESKERDEQSKSQTR